MQLRYKTLQAAYCVVSLLLTKPSLARSIHQVKIADFDYDFLWVERSRTRADKLDTLDNNFVNTIKSSRQIWLSHSLILRGVSMETVKFSWMTEVRMLSKAFIQELFIHIYVLPRYWNELSPTIQLYFFSNSTLSEPRFIYIRALFPSMEKIIALELSQKLFI